MESRTSELGMTQQAHDEFRRDVIENLSQQPKRLPCKYFYDCRGADLFVQICDLEEYYLTDAEFSILRDRASEMADAVGEQAAIVELGSGEGAKIKLLLDQLRRPAAYVPMDISGEQLSEVAANLSRDYPGVPVVPVQCDFTKQMSLPSSLQSAERVVAFFPGSTIGNFVEDEAIALLDRVRAACSGGGGLFLGFDLHKDTEVLEAAYNDAKGVTAEFNLNLLHRINRELDGTFEVDSFQHVAEYDEHHRRIEMYIESKRGQHAEAAGQRFSFDEGERILTEHCSKYSIDDMRELAGAAGWDMQRHWLDDGEQFAMAYFECG